MVFIQKIVALLAITLATIIAASPVELGKREQTCRLDAFDPKSWEASGAETALGDWLDKNGTGHATHSSTVPN